jgi:hypothetical protein
LVEARLYPRQSFVGDGGKLFEFFDSLFHQTSIGCSPVIVKRAAAAV